jgi:urate oxidase
MKLSAHRYGKGRVRVMKVLREGATHTLKELTASVALEGDFERSFTDADNSLVVPTDTMKNTVNVLAHEHLGLENEPFAAIVATHFVEKYPQIRRATVELEERVWSRLHIAGKAHPHSFANVESARPFTRLSHSREGSGRHESGVRDLLILKSAGSSFADFPKCEFTTLPETQDRIFATRMRVAWLWRAEPPDYRATYNKIIAAMLAPFAEKPSASVQATMWEMGQAALRACKEIAEITIAMPNLHCLPINLAPFKRENRNEVFTPTDEPHGQIEATISRE